MFHEVTFINETWLLNNKFSEAMRPNNCHDQCMVTLSHTITWTGWLGNMGISMLIFPTPGILILPPRGIIMILPRSQINNKQCYVDLLYYRAYVDDMRYHSELLGHFRRLPPASEIRLGRNLVLYCTTSRSTFIEILYKIKRN